MRKRVVIEKRVGETPLRALQAWVEAHPRYKDLPASYAGRLDPMASGTLLILFGDECKRQKRYTKLDKQYDIDVLLDIGSDTGDALGLMEYSHTTTRPTNEAVLAALSRELGTHTRAYPVYSSKTVAGKPLFTYALGGTLDTINIPTHEEVVYAISYLGQQELSTTALVDRLDAFYDRVPTTTEPSKRLGDDFRISAVRATCGKLFEGVGERHFAVLSLRVTCGSGAYMRSLAPRIGEALGTRALALSIHRRGIGHYLKALHYFYARPTPLPSFHFLRRAVSRI